MWDVAIVGSGPAGASCAAFCASAGLKTLVIERAIFPREKVCGDCLNPTCWPVLERLGVAQQVRSAPHGKLSSVEFISVSGRSVTAPLPEGENAEIAIKRSVLDDLLLRRARSLGAEVREGETLLAAQREGETWNLSTKNFSERAKFLVAADGRNSTVARLCRLMPRKGPDRVALQTHVPLPSGFGERVVLQLVREGYSGQAPVGDGLLNLCLVSQPNDLPAIRRWAERKFAISTEHPWRTIAPLARAALPVSNPGLLLVGDAARVVEPFTGEGIYYALRSGELAAEAIAAVDLARYQRAHRHLYAGRLWVNALARAAVEHPRLTSALFRLLPNEKRILRRLTTKVVAP
ncbi:MAG: geranylgeranyl reductase family protein [Chthoniobacterales bacterium]|nr:geranylgeranyl reductase family protein [Chthoniobacterales bacterium]